MNRFMYKGLGASVLGGAVLLIAVSALAPKVWAYNPHNLPDGTEVVAWDASSTGIVFEYSNNTYGNYPFTETASSTIDPVAPLLAYAQSDPTGASSMFPSGIDLTVSSNAAAVMTIFNFNPDQIGGQNIPPLTSLTASQESFLESAGYGTQLQTWEAEHSTPSSPSSALPPSSSTPPSSPSSTPPSSSAAASSPSPSTSTVSKTSSVPPASPSSSKPPTPVLPPVTPTLQKHPLKRAHPGPMPKSQRPVDLPHHHAPKDPPNGPSGWVWMGAAVVVLGGAGAVLKLRHIL